MAPVKSFFQRIPFIRITSLFLLGILVGQLIRVDFFWIAIIWSLLISVLLFLWNNKHFDGVRFQNILVSTALFLSGACYILQKPDKPMPIYEQKDYFLGEVCQKPIEKTNSFQSVLKIQSKEMAKPEKVIAYFSKDKYDHSIVVGDQLILLTQVREIKNTGNPYELDYKTMMKNKGIYSSVYLSPGAYHKTGRQINRLMYVAEHVRDRLIARLKATRLGDEELAVVSALTLGYRAELDQETMNYFVDTGTIHVLSVSGLHVGLIFIILNFLFSAINRGRYGKFIHAFLILLCLWGYAFITGFSPSVQRSTVMFSFVIFGNLLSRPVNIYNSLSASALVLLLLDPLVVYDIGFQLSYLAVFGIVLIQPPLENLLEIKNKILKWAWTMFTVSIAAQLVTFPLSIFYFNQFPSLFWLSSFVAIPGTTLVIWLTIAYFILSPVPILPNLLVDFIQHITHWLLLALKWMSHLPHAVIDGIIYTPFQTLIMYAIIITFVVYPFSKRKKWLYSGMVLLILFQASMLWTKYNLFNQQVLYIYQTKGGLIHCINGRQSYIIKYNDHPITMSEINMIQNVCDHRQLKRPRFIHPVNTGGVSTDDLKVNGHTLYFLYCRIQYSEHPDICVDGKHFGIFKWLNTSLLKKEGVKSLPSTFESHQNVNEAFYLTFSTNLKEGVCIMMN